MENHTLADGRNALNAFEQAKTAAIQQRLREVIAEDIDFVSQYEGDEFGKGRYMAKDRQLSAIGLDMNCSDMED